MDKVTSVKSVWENGQSFPHGWPVGLEKNSDSIGELEGFVWNFFGREYQISCKEKGLGFLKILPDQTGFVAIDGNPGKHAYVLNGDASVRFVLTPAFNMRGFDAERLAVVRQHDEERATLSGRMLNTVIPREEQTCFHSVDTSGGKLEIFGDDGLGDCYYTYDWNTGELLATRTLSRRS
ncbi:hypothetical protein J8I26_04685 [Herbaspirillum sp. LeCh32-8]|uniref:hypothetical protein n=1 Tax=Herbaspirillum sp. LeCh32-8 TaxID=2821356 RepID=UPI001AE5A00C|nr:hypothetical protein [Herbaspirillum sp. LeCh32-8]MBP0597388.1 hypothetical protein [Herbaspirillum sp. LeCh32-8]